MRQIYSFTIFCVFLLSVSLFAQVDIGSGKNATRIKGRSVNVAGIQDGTIIQYDSTAHQWIMGFALPVNDNGNLGQVLISNGSGSLIWSDGVGADWQGVAWDATNDTYARLGSLSDSSASATIPDYMLPIQSKIKRCVLDNSGNVLYYLDSTNSELKANGQTANIDSSGGLADGQVMVEIPQFYYYHGYDGSTNTHYWKISEDSLSGFTKFEQSYIGAYAAVLFDVTAGTYVGEDSDIYAAGDTLCSISGIKPHTNEKRSEYRTAAGLRGTGWHILDARIFNAVQILYLVEYADFNSQSQISEGNTQFSSFDYDNAIGPTGKSNSIGNVSGGQSTVSGDSLDFVSYRGIEDVFGNIRQYIDGVNINNDGSSSKLYVCTDCDNYADNTATNYTLTGNLAEADNYISDILNITTGFFPSSVSGGSSTTFLCDYYQTDYDTAPSGGWKVGLVGSPANKNTLAGLFSFYTSVGSSGNYGDFGTRLCYSGN